MADWKDRPPIFWDENGRAWSSATCVRCGVVFQYKPWTSNGTKSGRRFCSKACNKTFRGDAHWNAKGGRTTVKGYTWIVVPEEHRSIVGVRYKRRRMPEHVYRAAMALGRPLKKNEVVHHINGLRDDNRNCNLLVCDRSYHAWIHGEMSRLYALEKFGGPPID